jgi:hypothetical protein
MQEGPPNGCRERVIGMAQCEVCGNDYAKAFSSSDSAFHSCCAGAR